MILQYVADPDEARSRRDLAMVTEMLVSLAVPSTGPISKNSYALSKIFPSEPL